MTKEELRKTLGIYNDTKSYKIKSYYVIELKENFIHDKYEICRIVNTFINGITSVDRKAEPYKSLLKEYDEFIRTPKIKDDYTSRYLFISKEVIFTDSQFDKNKAESSTDLFNALSKLLNLSSTDDIVLSLLLCE